MLFYIRIAGPPLGDRQPSAGSVAAGQHVEAALEPRTAPAGKGRAGKPKKGDGGPDQTFLHGVVSCHVGMLGRFKDRDRGGGRSGRSVRPARDVRAGRTGRDRGRLSLTMPDDDATPGTQMAQHPVTDSAQHSGTSHGAERSGPTDIAVAGPVAIGGAKTRQTMPSRIRSRSSMSPALMRGGCRQLTSLSALTPAAATVSLLPCVPSPPA
jgi:hypothetical protein